MWTDRQTYRQTHTQDNYCNPRCACAPRVNEYCTISKNTGWRMECVHEVEPRCSLTIQPSCPTLRMLSSTSFSTQRTTPFSFPAGYPATSGMNDLQLLPSSTTKQEVWKLYHCTASADADTKAVGYSLFCAFWRKLTPQVVITHPTSDLCWVCQQNSNIILQAHNPTCGGEIGGIMCMCTRTYVYMWV